jgi:hypothetical protein
MRWRFGGAAGRPSLAKRRGFADNAAATEEIPMNRPHAVPRLAAAMLLALALPGCAPDAVKNIQATGFNAFLDRIAASCKPLRLGTFDAGSAIQRGGMLGDADYAYFLDITSRLYYGRVSPDAYTSGITASFGPGGDTSRSLDCILGNLDANRPLPPKL